MFNIDFLLKKNKSMQFFFANTIVVQKNNLKKKKKFFNLYTNTFSSLFLNITDVYFTETEEMLKLQKLENLFSSSSIKFYDFDLKKKNYDHEFSIIKIKNDLNFKNVKFGIFWKYKNLNFYFNTITKFNTILIFTIFKKKFFFNITTNFVLNFLFNQNKKTKPLLYFILPKHVELNKTALRFYNIYMLNLLFLNKMTFNIVYYYVKKYNKFFKLLIKKISKTYFFLLKTKKTHISNFYKSMLNFNKLREIETNKIFCDQTFSINKSFIYCYVFFISQILTLKKKNELDLINFKEILIPKERYKKLNKKVYKINLLFKLVWKSIFNYINLTVKKGNIFHKNNQQYLAFSIIYKELNKLDLNTRLTNILIKYILIFEKNIKYNFYKLVFLTKKYNKNFFYNIIKKYHLWEIKINIPQLYTVTSNYVRLYYYFVDCSKIQNESYSNFFTHPKLFKKKTDIINYYNVFTKQKMIFLMNRSVLPEIDLKLYETFPIYFGRLKKCFFKKGRIIKNFIKKKKKLFSKIRKFNRKLIKKKYRTRFLELIFKTPTINVRQMFYFYCPLKSLTKTIENNDFLNVNKSTNFMCLKKIEFFKNNNKNSTFYLRYILIYFILKKKINIKKIIKNFYTFIYSKNILNLIFFFKKKIKNFNNFSFLDLYNTTINLKFKYKLTLTKSSIVFFNTIYYYNNEFYDLLTNINKLPETSKFFESYDLTYFKFLSILDEGNVKKHILVNKKSSISIVNEEKGIQFLSSEDIIDNEDIEIDDHYFNLFYINQKNLINLVKYFSNSMETWEFFLANLNKSWRSLPPIKYIIENTQLNFSFFLVKNKTFINHKKKIIPSVIFYYVKPNVRKNSAFKFLKYSFNFNKKVFFNHRVIFFIRFVLFSKNDFLNQYINSMFIKFNKNLKNKILKSVKYNFNVEKSLTNINRIFFKKK